MTAETTSYTAFAGPDRLAAGSLASVALAVRGALHAGEDRLIQIFDDATGRVTDLDTRGTEAETLARLPEAAREDTSPRGRGRPKLGVVPGEVTLLPRHWDWLKAQPGGASVTLRKLIEAARHDPKAVRKEAQATAYRVMSALGGDRPGFEEAARALFAGDRAGFETLVGDWPADIRDYIAGLAAAALSERPVKG